MMERAEIVDLLTRMKALPEGADEMAAAEVEFDPYRLVEDPIVTNRIAVECLQQLPPNFKVDVILATSKDSELFAYSLATAAWARFAYMDPENGSLVNGYSINKDDKVLIVETAVNETTTLEEAVDLINAKKAKLTGVISVCHLGEGSPVADAYYPLITFSD